MINFKLKKSVISDFSFLIMSLATIALHDMTLLLLLAQMFFIITQITKNNRIIITRDLRRYLIWGLCFAGYSLLSVLWSLNNSTLFNNLASIIQVVVLSGAVIIYVDSKEKYEKAINYLTVGAILLCLRMVLVVPISAWGAERVGTYIGYGNVSITYSISYVALLAFNEGVTRNKKILAFLSIVLVVFSCLSGSKKAVFIALFAIVTIIISRSRNPLKIFRNIIVATVLVLLACYAVLNIDVLYDSVGYRIESMMGFLSHSGVIDKSTETRSELISLSFDVFKSHPILGVGLDGFRHTNPYTMYAHNNYMEILSDLGLIGFVIYYSLFFGLIKRTLRERFRKHNYNQNIVIIALGAILLMDIASVSYSLEPIHITIALVYSYYCITKTPNANRP